MLRKEKALREEMKEAKERQKAEAQLKLKQKEERAKIPPSELFRSRADLYSAFDETGKPTLDAAGQPLSKSALKNIEKEFQQQEKAHAEYLSKL